MKITDIQVHPIQAPDRTLVVVTVHTDDGIVGVGEAGLQRRWKAIDGAVQHMKRWLVGEDASRIEYLWQRMWRGGFYPADRLVGSAISGIDIEIFSPLALLSENRRIRRSLSAHSSVAPSPDHWRPRGHRHN